MFVHTRGSSVRHLSLDMTTTIKRKFVLAISDNVKAEQAVHPKQKGKLEFYQLTDPEGYISDELARRFLRYYIQSTDSFKQFVDQPDQAARLMLRKRRIEGNTDKTASQLWWKFAIVDSDGMDTAKTLWLQYLASGLQEIHSHHWLLSDVAREIGGKPLGTLDYDAKNSSELLSTGVRPSFWAKPTKAQNAALLQYFKSAYFHEAYISGWLRRDEIPEDYQGQLPKSLTELRENHGQYGPWATIRATVFVTAGDNCCYTGGSPNRTVLENVQISTGVCVREDDRMKPTVPDEFEITVMLPHNWKRVELDVHTLQWNMAAADMRTVYVQHLPTGRAAYYIPAFWEHSPDMSANELVDRLTRKALRGVRKQDIGNPQDVAVWAIPSYVIRESRFDPVKMNGQGTVEAINGGFFAAALKRPAAFAEQGWYPKRARQLDKRIDRLLAAAAQNLPLRVRSSSSANDLRAVIVPHAALRYSGKTAAAAFARVMQTGRRFRTAVILAPLHHRVGISNGCFLSSFDSWSTPLGTIAVDDALYSTLKHTSPFHPKQSILPASRDKAEHSLELVVPFVFKLEDVQTIVPIYVSRLGDARNVDEWAKPLARLMRDREDVLFVVSTDMTHWGSRHGFPSSASEGKTKLSSIDKNALQSIVSGSSVLFDEFSQSEHSMCGVQPVRLLLHALDLAFGRGNWSGQIEHQSRSDGKPLKDPIASNSESTVSYAAVSMYRSNPSENTGTGVKGDFKKLLDRIADDKDKPHPYSQSVRKYGSVDVQTWDLKEPGLPLFTTRGMTILNENLRNGGLKLIADLHLTYELAADPTGFFSDQIYADSSRKFIKCLLKFMQSDSLKYVPSHTTRHVVQFFELGRGKPELVDLTEVNDFDVAELTEEWLKTANGQDFTSYNQRVAEQQIDEKLDEKEDIAADRYRLNSHWDDDYDVVRAYFRYGTEAADKLAAAKRKKKQQQQLRKS